MMKKCGALIVFVVRLGSTKARSFTDGFNLKDTNNYDNGLICYGENSYDYSGYSVSGAGDINGDGYDDVIIGAYSADGASSSDYSAGRSYVVFGDATGSQDLGSLDGSNGFVIYGVDSYDYSGKSVSSAGDVNGDGYADLIIGASYADGSSSSYYNAGRSYIVYGGASVGSSGYVYLEDLDGSDGVIIYGVDSGDYSGWSVSSAGDFNGDGYDDVIIGAYGSDGTSSSYASLSGASYLVYGGTSVGSSGTLELSALTGSGGFAIHGDDASDYSGYSVSGAGDFNGDGYDDVIIGAFYADGSSFASYAGASYIVYGGTSVGSSGTLYLSALTGSDGFVLNGDDSYDYSGRSVSGAGDVNNDGYDDVIIGAYGADTDSSSYFFSYSEGETYVVLGGSAVATSGSFSLSGIDGTDGYRLDGDDSGDYSGFSVSGAGDFNGDGYDDVVIGAYYADGTSSSSFYDTSSGETYIVCDTKTSSSASSTSGAVVGAIIGGVFGAIIVIVCIMCGCAYMCKPQPPPQNQNVEMGSTLSARPAAAVEYAQTQPQYAQPQPQVQAQYGGQPQPIMVTATVVSVAPQGTKMQDL